MQEAPIKRFLYSSSLLSITDYVITTGGMTARAGPARNSQPTDNDCNIKTSYQFMYADIPSIG